MTVKAAMKRGRVVGFSLLILLGLAPLGARALDRPLTKDDVTLLLIGGASAQKMIAVIEQRGIDFRMNPDLAKKFHDDGASDEVIDALQKAGEKRTGASGPATAGTTSENSNPPAPAGAEAPPASGHAPGSASSPAASQSSAEQKIAATLAETSSAPRENPSGLPLPHANPGGLPVAPLFSLPDLDGAALNLADYKGKVVLLDFWATWCGPCRSEIPGFVDLQNRYRDQGFQVIGVSVDESAKPVRKFREQYRMNYPVAMCDRNVRQLYGLSGIPTTLLIGRDGRVYSKVVGASADLGEFDQRIQALLALPASGETTRVQVGNAPALPAGAPLNAQGSGAQSSAPQPSAAQNSAPASSASPGPDSPPAIASHASSASAAKSAPAPNLSDPSPEQIQQIIREFTTKEKLFKLARDAYTFHQINKVEELDADGGVSGMYQQEWDILYDDKGNRIERVTYAPLDTLKQLLISPEDLNAFRNLQPFVLTVDELPDYELKYLGHVKVDELTAYVFSVRPKELKKGRQYFQGVVWVDDRDLQIVKSEGKNVPETRTKHGENLYPRFTTYREQIDGKFWFPTYTIADDKLYFSTGPIHMKEVIRYTDYKQFKASSTVKIVTELPSANPPPKAPTAPPKKP
ncbi:MAG: hypothetical protein DMG26_10035 [Acidobacteria bacterium]|nr:MAG: hypothetical protein DMG26_10035 [Acidobacteriota bacterium]